MIWGIYCEIVNMLIRICLLVCAGILLVSANPVPQDTIDLSHNVRPLENPTAELSQNDDEKVESDYSTDNPPSNNDGEETDNHPETEDSGSENESETGSDSDEISDDSEGGKNELDPEDIENDSESEPEDDESDAKSGSRSDNRSESDLKTSESKDEENEDSENKNSVDNDNDKESKNDEPASDSGSGDEVFETVDLKPENENNISTIQYNGVCLRVYNFLKNDEGVICHELKRNDKIIDNRCFTMQPFSPIISPSLEEVYVSIFNKFIDGQDFICQEIISTLRGQLQVLCASKEGHFYHQSPVLSTGSSYTGLFDINIPFY